MVGPAITFRHGSHFGGVPAADLFGGGYQRQQALALNFLGRRQVAQLEECGHDVDVFDGLVNHEPLRNETGPVKHQGDAGQFSVHRLTVPHSAVLVEFFAMVRRDRDHGPVRESEFLQALQQARHFRIQTANRAVVPADEVRH